MITNTTPLYAALIGEAIFWFSAYALIVRRSYLDKTYGMPIFAMAGNITWEIIFAVNLMPACVLAWTGCNQPFFQSLNAISFGIDLFILATILKYGRHEFPQPFIHKYYYAIIGFLLAFFFAMQYVFMLQFGVLNVNNLSLDGSIPTYLPIAQQAGPYTGFFAGVLMGFLFIYMSITRDDLRGQSIYIALAITLGNAFAYLLWVLLEAAGGIITVMYVPLALMNVIYVGMVYQKAKALGINPWRRF